MSSLVDISLGQLASAAGYSKVEINYFLPFLKEIEAVKFVSDLCQAAYEIGFSDGWEDAE